MTLLEHLDELRSRLMWVIAAVGLSAIGGWFLFSPVVDLLLVPACPFLEDSPTGCKLIFIGPMEAFALRIKVAIYIGLGVSFPVILYHFWRFVAPGLQSKEKKYVIPFVGSGMVLFGIGVVFAYTTIPQALSFLIGPAITGGVIQPLLTAKQFIGFMLLYLVSFGIAFEFPLVLMFLSLARIITSDQMAAYRRHVLIGIAVVVAFLTPSADAYTMLALTAALYVMYEACIWLSRLLKR